MLYAALKPYHTTSIARPTALVCDSIVRKTYNATLGIDFPV